MAKKEIKNTKSSIEETLAGLEKTFGKGSIMLMNDSNSSHEEGVIPTGSVVLDLALGIGGLPRGRIVEIFGAESAGKTTLALSAVAQAQKLGGTAAYIDVEHALDPSYSQKIGIDLDKLLVSQPDSAEETGDPWARRWARAAWIGVLPSPSAPSTDAPAATAAQQRVARKVISGNLPPSGLYLATLLPSSISHALSKRAMLAQL